MRKQILSVAMILCLGLGMAGCGRKDIVYDLSDVALVFDSSAGYSMDVSLEMDVYDGGTVSSVLFLEGDGDVTHLGDMVMAIMAEGEDTVTIRNDAWYQDGKVWYRVGPADEEAYWKSNDYTGTLPEDAAGLFDAIMPDSLVCSEKDGMQVCSWDVAFSDIKPFLDIAASGIGTASEQADFGDLIAEATINPDTKRIMFLSIESSGGQDGSLKLVASGIKTGSVSDLSVPEDVRIQAEELVQETESHPKKGEWGQPWPDGTVSEPSYLDEGSDEVVDGIVESICTADPGFNLLEVRYNNIYETDMPIMYYSGSGSEWSATLCIYRYDSEKEARDAFQTFLEEEVVYYGEPVQTKEYDDVITWAVYAVGPSERNGTFASLIGIQGNMWMDCAGFDWEGKPIDKTVEELMQMVDATGLSWGR